MKKPPLSQTNAGFTLIEMLVSLALYTVVVTIAVGSLLVLIAGSGRGQSEQSVMTTLTFALDSMTREIRTGSGYYCESYGSSAFSSQESLNASTKDCYEGDGSSVSAYHGISFLEGGNSITKGSTRIAYYFDSGNKTIMRRVGNGAAESIVSDTISITQANFFVTGSSPYSVGSDIIQPTVTIVIEAVEKSEPDARPFVVETTVTQRELDI